MFKDVEFMTAKSKELTLKNWELFFKNGLQAKDFTHRIYHHLSQHCSFIAHYNPGGFYNTYFVNPEDTIRFISQFDSDKGCISIEYGDTHWIEGGNDVSQNYYDINQAMVDVVGKYKAALYKKLSRNTIKKDLTQAKKLLAKHGYKLKF